MHEVYNVDKLYGQCIQNASETILGTLEVFMDFKDIYKGQIEFQDLVKGSYDFEVDKLPSDIVQGFSYNIQHLISEIGEVLEADKRWKSMRRSKYDKEAKIQEICDCFIVLMNVAIYSGIQPEELEHELISKMIINRKRLESKQ